MTVSLIKRCVVVVALLVFALCSPLGAWARAQASPSQAANAIDVENPPADAEKTASGLASKVLIPGSGSARPAPTDAVQIVYVVHTKDGRTLSSGPASQMQLNSINVPGLVEGLQLMVAGEKRRIWMPESMAFKGQKGRPGGPVVFDVTLIDVVTPPAAPADVAAPPADAQATKSGLASKVIKPGSGSNHPTKRSTVTVHYTGWTTDGKMFDSSVMRGKPTSFPLDRVIAGWTEGVQLMVPGETRRFWIPEKLAYKGEDGKPKGMLVFDVELISIDSK
jgi:peptidylprolyl isomerase